MVDDGDEVKILSVVQSSLQKCLPKLKLRKEN